MSENQEKLQELVLSSSIRNLEFDISSECVRESNASRGNYKALTLDIMNTVKSGRDEYTMKAVANVVAMWLDKEVDYCKRVIAFCRAHEDIREFLLGENEDVRDIVIIVDDSTRDSVLDYNEFLFDIRGNYSEVNDFMVIDGFMKEAASAMYKELKSIYKRG